MFKAPSPAVSPTPTFTHTHGHLVVAFDREGAQVHCDLGYELWRI